MLQFEAFQCDFYFSHEFMYTSERVMNILSKCMPHNLKNDAFRQGWICLVVLKWMRLHNRPPVKVYWIFWTARKHVNGDNNTAYIYGHSFWKKSKKTYTHQEWFSFKENVTLKFERNENKTILFGIPETTSLY